MIIFLVSRVGKNARSSSFYRCFHINGKLYFYVVEEILHAVEKDNWAIFFFSSGEKTFTSSMTNNFTGFEYDYEKSFDKSCTVLNLVRIKPVKIAVGFDWYKTHL